MPLSPTLDLAIRYPEDRPDTSRLDGLLGALPEVAHAGMLGESGDPELDLAQGLTEAGLEPQRAQALAPIFAETPAPDPPMIAGVGEFLKGLFRNPKPVRPFTQDEAQALLKIKPGQLGPKANVLGTSDFKFQGKTGKEVNDELKRFIEYQRKHGDAYEKARQPLTDEQVTMAVEAKYAHELETYADVLKIPKAALDQVETRAVLGYLVAATKELKGFTKAARKKSLSPEERETALLQAQAQMGVVDHLMTRIAQWRRESGAVLREYAGRDLAAIFDQAHAVHDAVSLASKFGHVDADRLAAFMDALSSDAKLLAFFDSLSKRSGLVKDALVKAYIDALLQGHITFERNLWSDILGIAVRPTYRAVEGFYGRLGTSTAQGGMSVAPGEWMDMILALPAGFRAGARAVGSLWKTGESSLGGRGKVEYGGAYEHLVPDALPAWVKAGARGYGKIASVGSNGLTATDEFARAILEQMELRAQAGRYAFHLGVDKDAERQAYQAFLDPATRPASVDAAAKNLGALVTLTEDMGPLGNAWRDLADSVPVVGRMFLTFVQVPSNMLAQNFQHLPVLGALARKNRADLVAGGARQNEALARQTIGAGMTMTAAALAYRGFITGHGPEDPELKKRMPGFKSCAFKVGDSYYSFQDFEPWAGYFCGVADFVELYGAMDEQQRGAAAEALMVVARRWALSPSYMAGADKIFKAIEDGKIAEGFAQSLVPFVPVVGWSETQTIRNISDDKRMKAVRGGAWENEPLARELQGLFNQIRNRIPGYSKTLPADLGPLGEPIPASAYVGWAVPPLPPIKVGAIDKDDRKFTIYQALSQSGLDASHIMPPRTLPGSGQGKPDLLQLAKTAGAKGYFGPGVDPGKLYGVALTSQEISDFIRIRATVKDAKGTLEDALYNLVTSPYWKKLDPTLGVGGLSPGEGGTREQVVKATVDAFNKLALQDPRFFKLREAGIEKKLERAGRKSGQELK